MAIRYFLFIRAFPFEHQAIPFDEPTKTEAGYYMM